MTIRVRRYLAGFVREETALRDGSQNTKTHAADEAEAVGGLVHAAAGNTRVPRIAAPVTTPVDTKGA